jgi:DNA modification methylase
MGWRIELLEGDCRGVLPSLEAQSVQCCVTSPPYWGLRDYGTATWEGGDQECKHFVGEIRTGLGMAALGERYAGGGHKVSEPKPMTAKGECPHCGARRIDAQLGLEATPEEYIAKMVAVFREVGRVLRDDGTLWVNMGDSYAGSGTYQTSRPGNPINNSKASNRNGCGSVPGLKAKDLCGIPWMLAFALRSDGWYLRSDIIWHKPNPMPESVTDRPTKSHEYIFLLSKQERYYYNADAIKEPRVNDRKGVVLGRGDQSFSQAYNGIRNGPQRDNSGGYTTGDDRNKRSVWTVATQPYADAHFATFPEDLIKPCILAGSRPGDTVLDPFAGSGTTGKVAIECGRLAILIELSPAYVNLARDRTNVAAGFF